MTDFCKELLDIIIDECETLEDCIKIAKKIKEQENMTKILSEKIKKFI